MTLGLSPEERSHIVRASYMVRPVKRLPSKPWSGWPSVRGMSAAVMPMRRTVSAPAICGKAAGAVASLMAAIVARPFPDLLVRIAGIPLSASDGYFLCNLMQRLCQGKQLLAELHLVA